MYFIWNILKIIIDIGIIIALLVNFQEIIKIAIETCNDNQLKKDTKILIILSFFILFLIFVASLIENIYFSFKLLQVL